ncbi:MAG: cytochrome c [Acetobacteraceae bacterium]
MKKILVLATAIVAGASGIAYAQSGPNLIEMRKVGFALMAGDFAGIRAVAAAKGDVKTLENPAKAMARFAALIPSLFPEGTAAGGNTKALPEVWSNRAGFQKAADGLGAAATQLASAANAGDSAGVMTAIKAVGDACGACHKEFRAR